MKRHTQRGYINWKLLTVLILGVIVLAGTALVLRKYQQQVKAENALVEGLKAYEEERYEDAAFALGRYIGRHQDDLDAMIKYADAQVKRKPRMPGNIQQALGAYRIVLRANPTLVDAAKPLAELYIGAGSPGESKLIAERFLEKIDDPDMRRLLATAESSLGNTDLAIEQLTKLIQDYPQHELAYETLGLLLEARKRDIESARYWCEQAVEKNPDSLQAKIILIGFYLRHDQSETAQELMPGIEELTGQPPKLTLRIAQLWLELGQRELAEEVLTSIAETASDQTRYWEIKARLALVDGDTEEMLAIARDSRTALGERFWEFMPMAMELLMNGQALDEVQACIDEMTEKEYATSLATFFQGWIFYVQEDIQKAVELWQSAMGQGYQTVKSRLMLAGAYRKLNNPGAARQVLENLVSDLTSRDSTQALNVRDLVRARLALANQLSSMRLWNEAQSEALSVLQIQPDNRDALMLHAQASMRTTPMERWDAVDQQLERLLERNPDEPEILWLQYQSALHQKDVTTAQRLLTTLESLDGVEPLRLGLAQANLAMIQEQWDKALELLRGLETEYPDSFDVIRRLAAIYLQQDDIDSCERVLKEAMSRATEAGLLETLGQQLVGLYQEWERPEDAEALLADLDERLEDNVAIKRRRLRLLTLGEVPPLAQTLVDEIKAIEGIQGWQWKLEQARLWYLRDDFEANYPQLVTLLKENLTLNPSDTDSRLLLAQVYEKAGQLRLALATYREAVARNPRDLDVLVPYVSALFRADELDEANRMMAMIKDMQLDSSRLKPLEVQGYLTQGQYQDATAVLEEMYKQGQADMRVGISLAMLKINDQLYEEAAEILNQLLEMEPNSLQVVRAQVQLALVQDDLDGALAHCNQLIGRLPTAESYILRGGMYAEVGQFEEAEADYQRAIDVDPNNAETWFARYRFHRRARQTEKLLADVDQLLVLDPTNVQYLKEAIGQYINSGIEERLQQGRILLTQSLEANPLEEDLVLIKAQLLKAEGTQPNLNEALRLTDQVLNSNPRSELAWILAAQIHILQGEDGEALDAILDGLAQVPDSQSLLMLKADTEAARSPLLASQTLKELLAAQPENREILIKLVNVLIDAGRYRESLSLIDEHLSATEGQMRVALQLSRARALYETNRKDEAMSIVKELMPQTPPIPPILSLGMQLLVDDHRFSEAQALMEQWNQLHGEAIDVTTQMAGILYRSQQSEGILMAEQLLREQLELFPEHVGALEAMAEILLATEDYPGAVELYQQILTLEPQNVISLNNLAWLLSSKLQRYQEALVLVDRGLKLRPNYADMLDTRGGIYIALGQYERAIADLNKCISLYAADAREGVGSRFQLGKAYAGAKRRQEAITALNEALDLSSHIEGGLSDEQRAEAMALKNELLTGP